MKRDWGLEAKASKETCRRVAVPVALVSILFAACRNSDQEPQLVSDCSGTFLCRGDSRTGQPAWEMTLRKRAEGCFFGNARLDADGRVIPWGTVEGTWSGDTNQFDVCEGIRCIRCRNLDFPSLEEKGICRGSRAERCEDFGKSYACKATEGCWPSTDGCYGTLQPCSAFSGDSEERCTSRRGCAWQWRQ